jgi:hypothetical protein
MCAAKRQITSSGVRTAPTNDVTVQREPSGGSVRHHSGWKAIFLSVSFIGRGGGALPNSNDSDEAVETLRGVGG